MNETCRKAIEIHEKKEWSLFRRSTFLCQDMEFFYNEKRPAFTGRKMNEPGEGSEVYYPILLAINIFVIIQTCADILFIVRMNAARESTD